jgi:hypothetical protein
MGNHGSTLPVTRADVKLKLLVKTTKKSRPQGQIDIESIRRKNYIVRLNHNLQLLLYYGSHTKRRRG